MRIARYSLPAALTACLGCGHDAADRAPSVYEGLVINEVAAAGEPGDWFELFNGADHAIDLHGLTYSDDPFGDPGRAMFVDHAVMEPGDHLAIRVGAAIQGFQLGKDEALGLFAPDGRVIDVVDWADGDSPAHGSWARVPDGRGRFETLSTATPGVANDDDGARLVCRDPRALLRATAWR